ncbi:TetR/AcrR family transcriptional regulator [Shimia sp. R11_0]|uniref:HTH-type transcriptional regulator RutR n=1 Tax=Shimia marina TaxID=321267 RepID=A0A0P1ER59_9RHOB|nr:MULTISPECIES: TetR/AcrR family transcriptional regulator [Shimia]MBO9478953.1 TetR/AcrR family transcriptional regulator [Shimia sp. R11_0]CUH52482.1 HTH-type transcriptional regulator RutR [Shimia marina]SFE12970.1 transcriptional regulator, TetR family [Shimia marina]
MNEQTAIIRKGRKFAQVLESARVLFMQHGFESVRMDVIAQQAQVSKATLYNYFPDKRMLFMEVARQECTQQAAQLEASVDEEQPVPEVLTIVGRGLMGIILSEFGRNMFRVCVSECERFPELGQQFYETGPAVMKSRLIEFFGQAVARGELVVEDYGLAADQFAELCKAGLFLRQVTGVQRQFSPAEVEQVVDAAVAMFMARYGVK